MASPHLDLFRVLDAGVILYRTDPARPMDDPVPAESNSAAQRAGLSALDDRLLEAVRRAATFALDVSLTDLAVPGNGAVDARIHPLGDGWVAAVLTPAAPEDTSGRDPLTGLGNRERFLEQLQATLDSAPGHAAIAAVLVDLDRLQEVNDTLGHAQGDLLLRQSSARLRRLPFRTAVEPCRIGSDEFGLVVDLGSRDPHALATQVAAGFSAPFVLGRLSVRSTASVGVAVAPGHGRDAGSLLRSADVALSVAKRDRAGVAVYHPARDPFDLRRLQLLAGLRDAIDDGELTLEYQPKVDLATGTVAGVEALVRWHHAELGEISPGEFVPLAEDRGLIGPLSAWVLAESGRQCQAWGGHGFDVPVSANISAQNLYDPGLVKWLSHLFESGLEPGQLTLELTETQVVSDLPMARQILRRLRGLGAKLSIDDFGTGYSSLSYLSKLPLDELKIDRSFVLDLEAGPQGTAVVQTIIDLGHDLGLRVVAEGVESDETIATLDSLGCDQVQGFHVSRPLGAEALEDWLAARAA